MDRQVQQKFLRGINRRFDISNQDDPTRLYTLQNARLQKRGETGQVSRINGFEAFTNSPEITGQVRDSIMYTDKFVVLSYDTDTAHIHIFDIEENALIESFNFSTVLGDFGELTLIEDTIYITPHNKQLNFSNGQWYLNDFKSTTPRLIALEAFLTEPPSAPQGILEVGETYWYMVRITYQDNHKTTTCFPQRVYIGGMTRTAVLRIYTPPDLDGGLVRVEIFRKEGEEQFFLIDRVRVESMSNWIYHDTGRPKISAYNPQNYVWNETENSAAIVRDRYVRGGLTFMDREYEPDAVVTLDDPALGDEEYVTIPGVTYSIFARRRFPDGLLSPHALVDTVQGVGDKTFSINQPTVVNREVGFYMSFPRPGNPEDQTITFPTLEIFNANVPSIATSEDLEGDQERPVNPHIFIGFPRFQIRALAIDEPSPEFSVQHSVRDEVWKDGGDSTVCRETFLYTQSQFEALSFNDIFPAYIEKEFVTGHPVLYKRIATQNLAGGSEIVNVAENDGINTGVYEIAWLQGFKEYLTVQELNIVTRTVASGFTLSNTKNLAAFINTEVNVFSYNDLSELGDSFTVTSTEVIPNPDNRLYAIVSSDSIFNDVSSLSFNNQEVKETVKAQHDGRATLDMLNIAYTQDNSPTSELLTREGNDFYQWNYNDAVTQPVPAFSLEDSVVYLGSTSEIGTKMYPSGIKKINRNSFIYWTLPKHAIFETLLTSEDLEIFQENFPTLLIWSEPFILGTGINGLRNFTFTNFKSISQDYGKIIRIEYINNVLLVFCERGVNQVNVGETLTQQASGEVFVSSAEFLTTDQWILRNVPNIQSKSVKIYENMLFFSDGRDVWMFTNQLQNITNGAIDIGGVASPGCVSCASIDPLNKEYRITTPNGVWAYSMELSEWSGPYTYKDSTSSTFRDRMFSVVDGTIVEHNKGNTFDGEAFETLIESVSNDINHVAIDKLWRKFVGQFDGEIPVSQTDEIMEFSYGKVYSDKFTKNLFNVAKKSGLYHIGIQSEQANATQLYWAIRTDVESFVIRSIAYDLLIRNRP